MTEKTYQVGDVVAWDKVRSGMLVRSTSRAASSAVIPRRQPARWRRLLAEQETACRR